MYNKTDKELNDTIKSAYPENSKEIENEIINRNLTFNITLNERRVKKWRKFKRKKRTIKSLKRLQFQNVTENKKEILNSNTNTISIVGGTDLEDVRIDSDEKSDIEKSIVNVGMIGQLIPSRIISSSEEMIISAVNINACRTEGHGNIDLE